MSVLYTGIEMQSMDWLASLAASTDAFQAYVQVPTGDAVAARARLIEIDGPALTVAHGLIYPPRFRPVRLAGGAWRGQVLMELHCFAPPVAGLSDTELQRQAWNELSALRKALLIASIPIVDDAMTDDSPIEILDAIEPIQADLSDALQGWMCWGLLVGVGAQL